MNVAKGPSTKKGFIFKLITFIGIIVLILVSIALGKEIYRRYQINQEIKTVKSEIETLQKKNKELQVLVDYLNSDSYKEIQARQNLGLQKPGEQAVAIEAAPTTEGAISTGDSTKIATAEPTKNLSNPEKWWKYFFGAE